MLCLLCMNIYAQPDSLRLPAVPQLPQIDVPDVTDVPVKYIHKTNSKADAYHNRLGKSGAEKYVPVKELCKILGVSRQTVNNWRRSRIGFLIEPHVQKVGGKVLYDVAGIKRVMREHEDFFGSGRDYAYKEVVLATDKQRRERRFKDVRWRVTQGEKVSEEDRIFYEEECLWRGERSRV